MNNDPFQTPIEHLAESSDAKPRLSFPTRRVTVPQVDSKFLDIDKNAGRTAIECGIELGKCEMNMRILPIGFYVKEDKFRMDGFEMQFGEKHREQISEMEHEFQRVMQHTELEEKRKTVDEEEIRRNVQINISDEILCLTEEIIEQIRLQREQKGKKKQIHSAEQLFLSERCLEKFKKEFSKVLKHRYKTLKQENSKDNPAAVLFHFTKIENEFNNFEERTIQKYLGNEEDDGTEKREKNELKNEKRWKKCDKNLEYHRRNQQVSIEEVETVSGNFDKILKSDEEFTIKKQKLSANLILIVFLMFSAHNSTRECSGEQLRKDQVCAFEQFYPRVVDRIFLFLITLEENEIFLPENFENQLLSWLTTFRPQLVEFLPDGLDEFDFCN